MRQSFSLSLISNMEAAYILTEVSFVYYNVAQVDIISKRVSRVCKAKLR